MLILIAAIYIILLATIIFLNKERKFSKIFLVLFITWWCGLLAITTLEDNLYPMSFKAYSYLLILIVMFVLGYNFIMKFSEIKNVCLRLFGKKINYTKTISVDLERNEIGGKSKFDLSNYESGIMVWIVGLIIFTILLYYKVRYDELLVVIGSHYNRMIKFELGLLFVSPLENIFYIYVIETIINVFAVLLPIHIMNKKFKNPTIYISIALLYLSYAIGQGRLIIFETMFYFVITFIVFNYEQILDILKKKYILICSVLVIFISLLFVMSLVRYNTDFTDIKSIITNSKMTINHIFMYFTGPFRAFDYALSNNYREVIVSNYGNTYGLATICGFDEVVKNAINFVGIDVPVLNRLMGELTQQYIQIGPDTSMNAFFTVGLNYYIDFGLAGIIGLSFAYGSTIAFIVKKTLKSRNAYMVMFMILNLYYAFFSSVRWYYQHGATWMTFFIILFVALVHRGTVNSTAYDNLKRKMRIGGKKR